MDELVPLETNAAFTAQSLAVAQALRRDTGKVNGASIALGHPIAPRRHAHWQCRVSACGTRAWPLREAVNV
ncbi:hypothetical protein DNK06_05445 [Pseudomonas daroniae]|uniref:Thiolase C-terminal domain-containing protein n=1 Tax=Phytopseudomonas daroniae TaxID=2487519 RepID=A0A4Q9QQX2_9GAMM|nr:hypothetical protein DNK06_05445 [Pseudomonas daroniae]TBU84767.1 hypothetical protein DNK31_07065 [Pseudomonas sp. FRB 228]TBU92484.1 hypothetical protein DNJ99_07590 [Pseudomonas daroniae]